jgi:hypothetical protein
MATGDMGVASIYSEEGSSHFLKWRDKNIFLQTYV